jgi:ABC-type nitrate/sulfonate/bicarbonate transport system permease component
VAHLSAYEPPGNVGAFLNGTFVFLLVGALWLAASTLGLVSAFLLPSPLVVARTGWELLADGSLQRHIAISMQRVLLGYGLAVAVALPLALGFGLLPRLRALFEPPLEFLRQIPPPALLLWLGIDETQKVGVVVLACFFPIFLGALGGIAQADPKLVEVGRTCGLSRAEILHRIVLPGSLPQLVVSLRIGLDEALAIAAADQKISVADARRQLPWYDFTHVMTDADVKNLEADQRFMVEVGMLKKTIDVRKNLIAPMAFEP